MTGYHIEIGYNGAHRTGYDSMWEELKRTAREIADHPEKIVAEARRLNAPETCDKGCCHLDTYADNYKDSFETSGHPVSIIEHGKDRQIMQLASTADEIKYHVRRAYVRLVIEEMHRKGIEVNLTVA
ncbi:MAG: hypothetical protein JW725_05500 [Candidatus Babeliaceae bacterium]|nr:hypothetical protein [Candidatus Babeliaceae bacterium]